MIKGAMGSADVQPDDGLDSFQEDGGEHQPDESEMGVPNPRQLPERLIIRMPRDFGNQYVSFEFIKIKNKNSLEIIYESERGSNWARTSEGMVLTLTEGKWTVYDGAMLVDKMIFFAVKQCSLPMETLQREDGRRGVTISVPMTIKTMEITEKNGLADIFGQKPRCL